MHGLYTPVACGSEHARALQVTGGVECWGLNGQGQLGDGTMTSTITPVTVAGLTQP